MTEKTIISDFPEYITRVFSLDEMVDFMKSNYECLDYRSRLYSHVFVRQSFMYLAKRHGHSYNRIAIALGYNHPTCIHAYKRVEDYLYVKDRRFLRTFDEVVSNFNAHLKKKGNELLDVINARDKVISE